MNTYTNEQVLIIVGYAPTEAHKIAVRAFQGDLEAKALIKHYRNKINA